MKLFIEDENWAKWHKLGILGFFNELLNYTNTSTKKMLELKEQKDIACGVQGLTELR